MKLHTAGEDYLEAVLILQKEARYGAFRGCCPVHGGFKTQRMLRSRNFTRGRLLTTDENHYLHLTDLGLDVAEKIYERHCF